MAKAQDVVSYRLTFPDAARHYIDVLATVPVEPNGNESVELMMAVWTPGSYLVREYARHIESMSAQSDAAATLPIERVSKNRWRVAHQGARSIQLRYRLYARELTVRTNWTDSAGVLINGAAAFITRADGLHLPHHVHLELPSQWPHVATSLMPIDGSETLRGAANFDELVDSPLLLGKLDQQAFASSDRPHALVTMGAEGLWDGSRAAADLKRIVAEHHAFWGVVPYERYVFMNVINDGGGGLEHDNSTVLIANRFTTRDPERYRSWLSLASHEFFHLWNVRRLRPKPLRSYDYERETYLDELWIAEGITSYYDQLLVTRAGLYDETELLKQMSRDIKTVQTNPGRLTQSLRDASFDTWIKFYRPDENSSNSRVSYYGKGAMVAWIVDMDIRRATGNAKSLDDLMRQLYARHLDDGYTHADFCAIASELSGVAMNDRIDAMVMQPGELQYADALKWLGLRFKAPEPPKPGADVIEKPWIGVELTEGSGRINVKTITRDGPASLAGINVDDELIAVDGQRIETGKLTDLLRWLGSTRPHQLTIARRGQLIVLPITAILEPTDTWQLEIDPEASPETAANRQAWLTRAKP
jgi:predicted metalloprotease with PDZ domain